MVDGQGHRFKIVLDNVAGVFDVFFDGVLEASGVPTNTGAVEMFNCNSGRGGRGQPSFIDDLRITFTPPQTTFADFTIVDADIEFDTNFTVDDSFKVEGQFTLEGTSNGIDPLSEDVVVTVGTSVVTIPAVSFTEDEPGSFEFEGPINGADVKMEIEQIFGVTFQFKVEAETIDLTDTANPVDVELVIGDDSGTTTVRLEGELQFEAP